MSETIFLEKCQAYIDCHLQPAKGKRGSPWKAAPTITISRETGAGGLTVANHLANWLQGHSAGADCPWVVFHKNLVQRVLEDHHLPARFAQFMPEDKVSGIADAVEELLGLHPASWKLVRQTTESILQLAELGHAIVVGRAANFITAGMENTFHLRLVGSLDRRAERIMALHRISRRAALSFIRKSDAGRKRYVRRYYQQDIENLLAYHLVVNTDLLTEEETAEMVGKLIKDRFHE